MILKLRSLAESWRRYFNERPREEFFGATAILVATFLSLNLALIGVPAQYIFGHDVILLFDGGWRVFNGIKPYVDFYSPLGPVTYLYVALGYRLFGATVNSLAYMEALSLPLMMAVVWYSLRTRLSWFWLFWSTILIGTCLCAQHPPKQLFWHISYAMIYNRFGYSWLMLMAFLLFCPAGGASRTRLWINSLQIGAIFSLLFFIKVSFLIGAAPLLIGYFFYREKAPLSWFAMAIGFAATSLLFLAYLNFDVADILRDLALAAHARSNNFEMPVALGDLFGMRWQFLFGAGFVVASSRLYGRPLRDNLIILAAFIASSFAIFETNSPLGEVDELPLFAVLLILLSSSKSAFRPGESAPTVPAETTKEESLWLTMVSVVLGFYILGDAVSIVLPAYYQQTPRTWALFSADPMKDLVLQDDHNIQGFSYSYKVNDGLRLLRENNLTDLRCAALDFTSPFSFALGAPPPVGFPTFWQKDFTISSRSHPDEQRVFRGVDVILVPKHPEDPPETVTLLMKAYRGYLDSHFTVSADSPFWTILKRK